MFRIFPEQIHQALGCHKAINELVEHCRGDGSGEERSKNVSWALWLTQCILIEPPQRRSTDLRPELIPNHRPVDVFLKLYNIPVPDAGFKFIDANEKRCPVTTANQCNRHQRHEQVNQLSLRGHCKVLVTYGLERECIVRKLWQASDDGGFTRLIELAHLYGRALPGRRGRPARRLLAAVARGGPYTFCGGKGSRTGSGLSLARMAFKV